MFHSVSGKAMTINEIANRIIQYMMEDINASYEIIVGTDSQTHKDTKMVEIIAVHRKGLGGIFFHNTDFIPRIRNLKQKINEETSRSLTAANELLDAIEFPLLGEGYLLEDLNVTFQIHCDIGKYGKTNELIKEIVSWVTSQGYICMIKPDSYVASGIADRYSK